MIEEPGDYKTILRATALLYGAAMHTCEYTEHTTQPQSWSSSVGRFHRVFLVTVLWKYVFPEFGSFASFQFAGSGPPPPRCDGLAMVLCDMTGCAVNQRLV